VAARAGAWWRSWRARFGLAEVCGTATAVAGFAVGYRTGGSLLAAAGLATLGDGPAAGGARSGTAASRSPIVRHDGQVTDRAQVSRWLAGYESAWRAPGTQGLAGLFTSDAGYLQSPYEKPVTGLAAIARMWEEERDGPDEVFTVATDILAVDGATAVVRAEVRYGDPPHQEYRDLWVIHLGDDGRCSWFEEWPFWPGRHYTAVARSPGDEDR
jgi:hypothetical protein